MSMSNSTNHHFDNTSPPDSNFNKNTNSDSGEFIDPTEILINATQPEEIRVAMFKRGKVFDFDMESILREDKKASIYLGTISRVEPSLNAVFVDYGADRHGFLPLKEIALEYFQKGHPADENFDLKAAIREGQEVVVQISKEERGNKGAALSTFITLAGCYMVLMPNNAGAGGISRRIEGEDRQLLKDALDQLEVPQGMGVIIRTNGLGRSQDELQWDLNALIKLSNAIQIAAKEKASPCLIYRESDVISRTIRDYLRSDISKIVVDTVEAFERVMTHVNRLRPEFSDKVVLYRGDKPLFIHYNIEHQIETAYAREVKLPSGGSLVIDHTEALTSIDINSSKATKGEDIEETALETNLEAAMEIARQVRLRDMGGLIVIDFIDMLSPRHQRDVETQLQEALKQDRARVQVGRISKFGLLEMSRQRLRPSLDESTHMTCPRCLGQGSIRNVESLGLSILRVLEEEASTHLFREFHVELPVSAATFLLNEKRAVIHHIETRRHVKIIFIPNAALHTPHYEIRRFKHGSESIAQKSFELMSKTADEKHSFLETPTREDAAIKHIAIDEPPKKPSLVTRLFRELFSSPKKLKGIPGHQVEPKAAPGKNKEKDREREKNKNKNNRTRSQERNIKDKETETTTENARLQRRSNRSDRSDRSDRPERVRKSDRTDGNKHKFKQRSTHPNESKPSDISSSESTLPHPDQNLALNNHENSAPSREQDQVQTRSKRQQSTQRRSRGPLSENDSGKRNRSDRSDRSEKTLDPTQKKEIVVQSMERYTMDTTAPAQTHAISEQVKAILENSTYSKEPHTEQTRSNLPADYHAEKKLSVAVQEERTEFSLEDAKAKIMRTTDHAEQVKTKNMTSNSENTRLSFDVKEI